MYKDKNGQCYILDNKIESGGDGSVYNIKGEPNLVAKIFHDTKLNNKQVRSIIERKVAAMISMDVSAQMYGALLIAWPKELLYVNGNFCGYVMPKVKRSIKGWYLPLATSIALGTDGFKAKELKEAYPEYTWKYSFQFAYNLAYAVRYAHAKGIIIGNLNPGNLLLDKDTGAIVLIDCDEFDITDIMTGERFPCEVGLPEMLAPELQTVGQLKGKFTTYTDDFSLAILIFRMLMAADPFSGVPIIKESSTEFVSTGVNIVNGNCPYVRNCSMTVPRWTLDFSVLPLSVQNLFKNTFDYNATTALSNRAKRATASEWCSVLAPFGAREPNTEWVTCVGNKRHVYPAHNKSCPWCSKRLGGTVDNKTDYPEYHKGSQDWLRTSLVYAPPKLSDSGKSEACVPNKKDIWGKLKNIWKNNE